MITRKNAKPDALQQVIDNLLTKLVETQPNTKEYAEMVTQLTALYKLKENNTPKPVSRDTLFIVAGNLAGIALILGFEKVNVVTSRAIGFVLKAR